MILYLHGFRSSPQSAKASLLAEAVHNAGHADLWHCPQLPPSPRAAIQLADELIAQGVAKGMDPERDLVVLGSSLGGYYAGCLAEKHRCRALRSEEHTSELQSRENLVCRLLLEKKKQRQMSTR